MSILKILCLFNYVYTCVDGVLYDCMLGNMISLLSQRCVSMSYVGLRKYHAVRPLSETSVQQWCDIARSVPITRYWGVILEKKCTTANHRW